jgi:hypothetical protein
MAYGLPVEQVIDSMRERGVFLEGSGVRDEHLKWFLSQNMQGYSEWLPIDGCGPLPGHHLVSILSSAIPGATHYSLMLVTPYGDTYLYDPSAKVQTPKLINLNELIVQNFITLCDWSDMEFLK